MRAMQRQRHGNASSLVEVELLFDPVSAFQTVISKASDAVGKVKGVSDKISEVASKVTVVSNFFKNAFSDPGKVAKEMANLVEEVGKELFKLLSDEVKKILDPKCVPLETRLAFSCSDQAPQGDSLEKLLLVVRRLGSVMLRILHRSKKTVEMLDPSGAVGKVMCLIDSLIVAGGDMLKPILQVLVDAIPKSVINAIVTAVFELEKLVCKGLKLKEPAGTFFLEGTAQERTVEEVRLTSKCEVENKDPELFQLCTDDNGLPDFGSTHSMVIGIFNLQIGDHFVFDRTQGCSEFVTTAFGWINFALDNVNMVNEFITSTISILDPAAFEVTIGWAMMKEVPLVLWELISFVEAQCDAQDADIRNALNRAAFYNTQVIAKRETANRNAVTKANADILKVVQQAKGVYGRMPSMS
jgi:hypothetical protein